MSQDPQTRDEWQEAVDAAHSLMLIASARTYGLVRGGPAVDEERCDEILRRGAERGITPSANAIENFIGGLSQ